MLNETTIETELTRLAKRVDELEKKRELEDQIVAAAMHLVIRIRAYSTAAVAESKNRSENPDLMCAIESTESRALAEAAMAKAEGRLVSLVDALEVGL